MISFDCCRFLGTVPERTLSVWWQCLPWSEWTAYADHNSIAAGSGSGDKIFHSVAFTGPCHSNVQNHSTLLLVIYHLNFKISEPMHVNTNGHQSNLQILFYWLHSTLDWSSATCDWAVSFPYLPRAWKGNSGPSVRHCSIGKWCSVEYQLSELKAPKYTSPPNELSRLGSFEKNFKKSTEMEDSFLRPSPNRWKCTRSNWGFRTQKNLVWQTILTCRDNRHSNGTVRAWAHLSAAYDCTSTRHSLGNAFIKESKNKLKMKEHLPGQEWDLVKTWIIERQNYRRRRKNALQNSKYSTWTAKVFFATDSFKLVVQDKLVFKSWIASN